MNPYGSSQSSINPALLAQYQGNYNTAQLMNGMMSQSSISPSQLLNQQQQQHHHHQQMSQQRAVMNGGMNMMGIGINANSPASPANQMPVTATSLIAMGHHPNNQQILAYGREQQQASNSKLIMAAQQMHMQHQQMPQQQQYDPSSQIMPPHSRPPTAQSSRPGTAMDINTRSAASPPRPLSRTAENGIMGVPMYHVTPAPSMSPPPASPSPYRTGLQNNPMKRKMPDQSPIGMNMMGMSPQQGINGYPSAQAQPQHQSASPGPMGNNIGMSMNGMAGMNMVQSGNLGNIPGMGNMAMGMNDLNNSIGMAGPMAMGMPQQVESIYQHSSLLSSLFLLACHSNAATGHTVSTTKHVDDSIWPSGRSTAYPSRLASPNRVHPSQASH